MRRWNWALAYAVLRGRVVRIERALGYGQDSTVVHLVGPGQAKVRWGKRK